VLRHFIRKIIFRENYGIHMKDRLLTLRKPKDLERGDHSNILCCPFCKASFERDGSDYVCKTHGVFKIDSARRPLLVHEEVLVENIHEHTSGVNWLKSFFKQFPKLYYSIWHVFCPVMMLVNGPRMVLKYIKKDGVSIDVGSGPERLGKEFINVDMFPFPEVDIVALATELPFRDNSIDAAVSESVFEHVPDAYKVAREMVRVVKPGGIIYVSAPFIHPYHASPDDFNRWTISGLKHLFPDIDIIESGVRSGPWSAFLMFMAYWLGVIFSFGSKKLAPFLAHVFMLVLGPLKYFDYFFMKMPGAEAVSAHLYILGRKP
jgi:SAM-dependent methyltransferase